MKTHRAIEIARTLVDKGIAEDRSIDNLQLQKMMYFIQQESLLGFGVPAFDDTITAEAYGPVVCPVFRTFSLWGGRPIAWREGEEPDVCAGDPDIAGVICRVFDSIQPYRPWELVTMYNVPESPWGSIWEDGAGEGLEIPLSSICGNPLPLP